MPDQPPVELPAHVTTPLLTLVTEGSLDQDYTHVAQRRASSEPTSRHPVGTAGAVLLVLALFGLLVSTAAGQSSRNAGVDETSRAALIAQIEARRESLSRTQDRIGRLRADTTLLEQRREALAEDETLVRTQLEGVRTRTGYGAAQGPGVRVQLADSPSGVESGVVRDSDLALLVDALWGAGAEGIAVDGHRLTALSAFRNVGPAVHVNGVPLTPPYVVEAIGDPRTLQSDLVEGARGQEFLTLADAYGFEFDMANQDLIVLPAATLRALRSALVLEGDNDSGPSASADGEGRAS